MDHVELRISRGPAQRTESASETIPNRFRRRPALLMTVTLRIGVEMMVGHSRGMAFGLTTVMLSHIHHAYRILLTPVISLMNIAVI